MQVIIREERPEDIAAIRRVNADAFGQPQEAALVDQLRTNKAVLLSLVAAVNDRVAGHILFSPVRLEAADAEIEGAGLAPMAVAADYQRKGIGSKLVQEGIRRLSESPCPFIVVLGHSQYYPRFGFVPASRYGVRCKWDVPDDAFLVLALDPARSAGASGVVRYRPEFDAVA